MTRNSCLSDLLKDRPLSVKKIKTLSHQSGHSWITVRRAKEQLGIRPKKESFSGEWIWNLTSIEKYSPKENHVAQTNIQGAHTQKDEHLEHVEHLRQNLNNFKENSLKLVQSLNNVSVISTKNDEDAQGAQVEKNEQHELAQLLIDSSENSLHKQNLTNSEKPKEEEVFIIDVSDLLEKKDA